MKGDFSRNSFDPNKHYRGVRMQQGRVQMDADWNEQIDITDYRDRLFTEDFLGDAIGPSSSAGFAIDVATDVTTGKQDLTIGLGRYYVNGLLVENSNSLYFTNQTDYPNATLPTQNGVYLVYLDVWQRSLSMADDADMTESALGGADTATRLYTVAQVKLMPADSTGITNLTYNALFDVNAAIDSPAYNNAQQWNAMANRLPPNVDAPQLLPDVGTLSSSSNTTYRIQIHQGGDLKEATYKTSIDNPLVEITITTINGNIISLSQAPSGQAPFAVGQWLELTTPGRDAARTPGDMTQIIGISGDEDSGLTITFSGAVGVDITIANAALARRWQQNAIAVANSNKNPLETGLAINFLGNAFESGNYWQITTDTANHTINWPSSNGKFIALPPNSNTISQLTPSVADNPSLQNQLYRVEIHQGGDASTAMFKWSRDNASVSSSISAISSNNITLSTLPQDGINGFAPYQWLELTTPARELTGVPGDMVQITAVNGATLTVSGAIGADITVANNAIARRWDTAVTNSANQAVNPVIISTALALENGLSVTFAGSDFRMGDYWLIPARAALNSQGSHIDWPMDDSGNYLTQLPNGIQRSYAPLAIVQCNNGRWSFESDARTISIPLSELNIKVIGADPCAPADTIHVDCNGQVGISTDTPSAKLDVETSTAMTGQDAIHAMANSNGIAIQAATNNNIAAIFKNNSTQPTLQLSNNGSGQALQTQGDVSLDGSLTISNIDSGSFSVLAAADKVPAGNSSGYLDASWLVKAIPAGAMLDFAGAEPPTGFLLCDGRAVSRTTYATLFAAIGVIWGAGDGSTTFNLPDFQRRVAMGSGGTGSNIIGNVVGGVGGVEKYTLGINDLPNHTHNGAGGGNNRFIVDSGYNGDGGAYTQGKYNSFSSTTGWVTNQVAHNAVSLVQPSAIVTKIIKY